MAHDLFTWLYSWLSWLVWLVWETIKENLGFAALAAAYGVARMFGTVVETGWRGVLFRFGRARMELEPGFHFLMPVVHHVRKMRVRSVSVNLPPQRVATRDGLVFDVEANVVYHVEHATAASVQIDDVHKGCRNAIPLVVAALFGRQTSGHLTDRGRLDEEFARRLQARLERWGLMVEKAGLKSIAPTRETLRVTQLSLRCQERRRLYAGLTAGGASPAQALGLLGASTRIVERSVPRYRNYRRGLAGRQRFSAKPQADAVGFRLGDRVWAKWLDLGEFYPGVIARLEGEFVHVKYDDGDEETVHVRNVRREKPEE